MTIKKNYKSFVMLVALLLILSIFVPFSNAESLKVKNNNIDINSSDFIEENIENTFNKKSYFSDFVPGELIVKFKDTTKISPQTVNNQLNIGVASLDLLNIKYNVVSSEKIISETLSTLSNIYKLTVPKDSDIRSIVDEYNNDPNVEYAEPNLICHLDNIPNDPLFNQQWGLHNTGQSSGKVDADIDAPEAWDIATEGSDVTIAVIDSGVDYNHPDLIDNMWINSDEIADNGIDDDNNGYIDDVHGWDFIRNTNDPKDEFGHGTHCAGIIGATGNNSIGVSGVCWNSSIMPVKVFTENGGTTTGVIARGINYATNNGAKIFSMSWGFSGDSELITDVLENAYSKGIVLVSSAGNSNSQRPHSPAKYDHVIGVAAIDRNNEKASFSNYGNWIDVAAPGVDIFSTMPTYPVLLNDYGHTPDYSNMSGTSMSAPFIAGVIGLVLSNNPDLKQEEIKTLIQSAASDVSSNGYIGVGNTNLLYCLQNDTVPIVNLRYVSNSIEIENNFEISGSASGDTFKNYKIYIGPGFYPDSWDQIYSSCSSVENDVLTSLDSTLFNDGQYSLKLEVEDLVGKKFQDRINILINNEKTFVYVDDDKQADYSSISDAVNNSGTGDTIFVHNGTYSDYVFVDKSIDLIGESKENTIITDIVVYYNTINVIVTNFTFTRLEKESQQYNPENYDLQYLHSNSETDAMAVIYTYYRLGAYNCDNITISDNIFEEFTAPLLTSEQYLPGVIAHMFQGIGINMVGCSASHIINNVISGHEFDPSKTEDGNSPTVGIDISSDSVIVENNIILNNNVLEKSDEASKPIGFSSNTKTDSMWDFTNESLPCGIKEMGEFNIFRNNVINNNLKGFNLVLSQYTNINNNILKNNKDAIFIDFSGSIDANIHHNIIENNQNGIASCIGIAYNNIHSNIIENNSIGIHAGNYLPSALSIVSGLITSYENKIYHNSIKNNSKGVYIEGWVNSTISDNNIENNSEYGLNMIKSEDNEIYRNNFVKNGRLPLRRNDAFVKKGRNTWDNGTQGNYWDNYKGLLFKRLVDPDGDGFGNLPYIIPRFQFDKHPKLEPYSIKI